MPLPLYQDLARALAWSQATGPEYQAQAQARLARLVAVLPSGSGIDCGTKLLDQSKPERLVFGIDFHTMDQNGYYSGWAYYRLVVKPSLQWGVDLRLYGPSHGGLKDYLYELYDLALRESAPSETVPVPVP